MAKRLFSSALYAGLIAGLIASALQFWLLVPLIGQAELYETGALVHFETDGTAHDAADPAGHDHAAMSTEQDGTFSRHVLSFFMNLVIFTGFSLLVVAVFGILEQARRPVTPAMAVVVGLVGFAAFQLAPAVGLPPELPGTPAADVGQRQYWWGATALCTAAALALLLLRPGQLVAGAIAVALLIAPHIVGAPHLGEMFGVSPPELAGLFAARSLAVGAVCWVVLGGAAGYFWTRRT